VKIFFLRNLIFSGRIQSGPGPRSRRVKTDPMSLAWIFRIFVFGKLAQIRANNHLPPSTRPKFVLPPKIRAKNIASLNIH
jgi:hypothetical protein